MSPTTPRSSNRLKLAEAIELVEFMKTVCNKIENTPFCEYVSPWDDQKVADRMKCTVGNVKGTRQAMFGKLKLPMSDLPRMDRLEKDLTAVMDYLTRKDPNWRGD